MSGEPNCTVCDGAGWDWRRAADEQQQIDDPVDYYRCLCAEPPHDHKGHSEEKCVRCGWVMGHRPLNCINNDTPHVFPSQQAVINRLMDGMELAWVLIANGQYWDRTDGRRYGEWNEARAKWRDEHWHPALDRNKGGPS